MRVAGLSGGIATGKSSVTQLLRKRGIPVIDADEIAHNVVKKGHWGYRRLVAAFGDSILLETGEVDREKLGRLVFGDAVLRRRLNAATHLPVALELLRCIAWHWLTCTWVVVVDMPLLFETGANKVMYPNILVACEAETQVQRLMQRDGFSEEDARSRIAAQWPLARKRALATLVLENDGDLAQLEGQVAGVVGRLRRGALWRGLLLSPLAFGLALTLLVVVRS